MKRIIHDYYWKESKDSEPIHTHTHTHKTDKYKRKMCYQQKNNSNIKTFERLKNIKESWDLLPINFWNKAKCIWLHNKEIWKKNWLPSKE